MFKLSLKMTLRDWRAGELHLLLAALVVSVAALSAVGFFTDRIRGAMLRDATQLLAADLLVTSDAPLDPAWQASARQRALRTAVSLSMVSMAGAGEGGGAVSSLVSLKAVTPGYPLRGALQLRGAVPGAAGAPVSGAADSSVPGTAGAPAPGAVGGPATGTAWIDSTLEARLNVSVGDRIRVGDSVFLVAQVITSEPDRRFSPVNLSPRVMIAAGDLPATGLMAPGARARHSLLVAGDGPSVEAFRLYIKAQLDAANASNMRVQTARDRSSEMGDALERASGFLSLVSLLTAMLAAVAIAMAARRYMLRHVDACAMLRCLGLRQRQVMRVHLIEFALVGLAGGAIGALAGYAGHLLLLRWLEGLLPAALPPAGWLPAAQALAAGLILLAGFALPPLLQLANVSHARLLRREHDAPRGATLAAFALGGAMFTGLLLWQTGDAKLGAATAAGFLAAGLLFAAAAWLGLKALALVRGAVRQPAWRFAITAMQRHPGASIAQTVSLAVGLMALLLLTVVRGDLMAAWRAAVPLDAPNHYLMNIPPDQREEIAQRLRQFGQPPLHANIRGRLLTVNGRPAGEDNKDYQRPVDDNDFDLSTAVALPPASTLTGGTWFQPGSSEREVSVDEEMVKDFGIKLGDRLAFDIGGLALDVKVTSVRKINWRARKASFVFVLNEAAAAGLPRTYSASFHVQEGGENAIGRLSRDYPGLTMFNFGFLIRQLHAVLAQVSVAVEFLFLFTLAAGLLVLYAALAGSQDVRMRQSALMRALGATRSQLSRAQWFEHLLTGTLAGLLAAGGASAGSWALARFTFDLPWSWSPQLWLAGLLAGVACAAAGGWLGLRNVLNHPPLLTLRQSITH